MNAVNKRYESGIIYVLIFVVLGAFQEVYVGSLVQKVNPILVMTVTFGIALVYFNLLAFKNKQHTLALVKNHKALILILNVTTALSWFGFMVSLKYLEPAIVSCICFSVGPILTSLFNPIFNRGSKILKGEVLSAIGMGVGVLALTYSSASGVSGLGLRPSAEVITGIIAATCSAVGIMGNTFFSKKMSVVGFSSSQTMSLRFFLLTLFGAATLILRPIDLAFNISFVFEMLALSVATVILPLYLLQVGIERLEPITVSLLISSMPVVTFFLQLFDHRLSPSLFTLAGVAFCFIASAAGVFVRYHAEHAAADKR
jgi:drug/metabolite transporter (DMT)-like permease